MAENKKSFLLYCDLVYTISKMPNDKAGELFKHILEYVNDNNPVTEDLIIQLTFEPIKQQLKRDLAKYQDISSKRSEIGKLAGIKSGEARRTKTKQNEPIGLKTNQNEQDKEIDTVIDKDTVKVKDKENKKDINNIAKTKVLVHPSFSFIKNTFLNYYLEQKQLNYNWQPIDGLKTNSIIKKILFQVKTTYPDTLPGNEEKKINDGFLFILKNLNDNWIIENLSLAIIDSKFNIIISKIKNPAKNGKQSVIKNNKSVREEILTRDFNNLTDRYSEMSK